VYRNVSVRAYRPNRKVKMYSDLPIACCICLNDIMHMFGIIWVDNMGHYCRSSWKWSSQCISSRVQSDVTELHWTEMNWHGLVFVYDQWASKASLLVIGWRLREHSQVGHRRRKTVSTVMHYCSPIGQFVKNEVYHISSVQLRRSACVRFFYYRDM